MSTTVLDRLRSESQLLDRLYYRNCNQHRSSPALRRIHAVRRGLHRVLQHNALSSAISEHTSKCILHAYEGVMREMINPKRFLITATAFIAVMSRCYCLLRAALDLESRKNQVEIKSDNSDDVDLGEIVSY